MSILMVTGIEGARNCAAVVGAQLGMEVEVAEGAAPRWPRCAAASFWPLVVDETMAECDPAAAESHLGARRPGHSSADQLRPLGSGAAHPRDSRGAASPRARAGAGPPRRRGGHRDRAQVHGCRPAAALATGLERQRNPGSGCRPPPCGRRSGRQPAPAVDSQISCTLRVFSRAFETLLLFAVRPQVTASGFIALFSSAAYRTRSTHSRLHLASFASGSFVSRPKCLPFLSRHAASNTLDCAGSRHDRHPPGRFHLERCSRVAIHQLLPPGGLHPLARPGLRARASRLRRVTRWRKSLSIAACAPRAIAPSARTRAS
jgi:hypothetical protein